MRYRLRTLVILLAVGPLVLALAIFFLALHGFVPGLAVTTNGEVKVFPR